MKRGVFTEELDEKPSVLAKIFPAGGEMVRRPSRICQAGFRPHASATPRESAHGKERRAGAAGSVRRRWNTEETPDVRGSLDRDGRTLVQRGRAREGCWDGTRSRRAPAGGARPFTAPAPRRRIPAPAILRVPGAMTARFPSGGAARTAPPGRRLGNDERWRNLCLTLSLRKQYRPAR